MARSPSFSRGKRRPDPHLELAQSPGTKHEAVT
jgi:hypothetical protein